MPRSSDVICRGATDLIRVTRSLKDYSSSSGSTHDRRLLIFFVFFVSRRHHHRRLGSRRQRIAVKPTDNQVEKFGMCGVMSVPFGMSHRSIVRAATGLAPCASRWPWTVLNVLPAAWHGRPPFWGDRASRCPTLGSLAAGSPTRRHPEGLSTQSVTEARADADRSRGWGRDVERPGPCQARRGEDGAKKAFLTSDARMGILSHMLNHGYLAQTLRRPLPTKDGGNPAHRGRRGQLYCRIRKIGDGAIGTALFDSSWIWRTHPRSAASSNSPCFTIGSSISKRPPQHSC